MLRIASYSQYANNVHSEQRSEKMRDCNLYYYSPRLPDRGSVPRERFRHLSMEFILWESTVQLVSVPRRCSENGFHFVGIPNDFKALMRLHRDGAVGTRRK